MSGSIRRRTISFDESVLAEAERLAAERGESLSTFVNAAVERHLKVAGRPKLVQEDTKRWGPASER